MGNLLMLAGLAEHFSVIWTMPYSDDRPNAVYNDGNKWHVFEPPTDKVNDHKADVVQSVLKYPASWFPQLEDEKNKAFQILRGMRAESLVLVDDEHANFRSATTRTRIMRFVKVSRYDAGFLDCQILNHMGGIGAHTDKDYEVLRAFVHEPWTFQKIGGHAALEGVRPDP